MKPVFVSAYFLEGESLPVACNPTTSRNERVQPRSTPKKPLPKVMNARHLSGGKRTKEAIDVQRSSVPQEIYKPPPGSMFFISFLYSHPLSAAGHCFDIVKRDYLFVTLVRNTCNPSPPPPSNPTPGNLSWFTRHHKMQNLMKVLSRFSNTLPKTFKIREDP